LVCAGLLGLAVADEDGGSGVDDYRFRCVFAEEIARAGVTSFGAGLAVQADVVIPYLAELGTPEQKKR